MPRGRAVERAAFGHGVPNRTAGLLQGGPRIRCDEGWGFWALHRVFGVMVGG